MKSASTKKQERDNKILDDWRGTILLFVKFNICIGSIEHDFNDVKRYLPVLNVTYYGPKDEYNALVKLCLAFHNIKRFPQV